MYGQESLPPERVDEAVRWARRSLPSLDAELLIAYVLGVPRTRWRLAPALTSEQRARYGALIQRRAAGVPVQYLTATAAFRNLELSVGRGVFIPRPETELLVQWGLDWSRGHDCSIVVDLCAGSGAIALAVATEAPATRVYAVEREPDALDWLRRNVARLAPGGQVTVTAGDATDPSALSFLEGTVDLVLSNPPYVPRTLAAQVSAEVRDHEPEQAVFGGHDGLDVIRPLIPCAAQLLRPGGGFACEHDETRASDVGALVAADGRFRDIRLHHDLNGRPRFTTATRA